MKRLNFLHHHLHHCWTPHPPSRTKKRFIQRDNIVYVYVCIIFQQDKKHESSGPESSTPQNKKKGKKKPNRFKNHIKARALISRLSKGTGQQNKERPSSPTLSYDSGSGDEEGPQLGIGVKTFEKVITDSVSVHWPIQCQVSFFFFNFTTFVLIYITKLKRLQVSEL